jgi:hypothetical protein
MKQLKAQITFLSIFFVLGYFASAQQNIQEYKRLKEWKELKMLNRSGQKQLDKLRVFEYAFKIID